MSRMRVKSEDGDEPFTHDTNKRQGLQAVLGLPLSYRLLSTSSTLNISSKRVISEAMAL